MYDNSELQEMYGYLPQYVERITEKSKGQNMYVCPFCHSGEGKNHSGAFSVYYDEADRKMKWKCFACGKGSGDIFELIKEYEGIADFRGQVKRVRELFGLADRAERTENGQREPSQNHTKNERSRPQSEAQDEPSEKEQEPDYSSLFAEWHKNIAQTDYPQKRGLSAEVIDRYNLGFCPSWKHPKVKSENVPYTPRLIIPTSSHSYLARDTREDVPEAERGFTKAKVGAVHFFNVEALQRAQKPVFIVEGEIDALSVIEVGGEAVGLGSAVMTNKFLSMVRENRPSQPLIICLDNDDAGNSKSAELEAGLEKLGIFFYRGDITNGYKDANEALIADRRGFTLAVMEAEDKQEEEFRAEQQRYRRTSTAFYMENFLNGVNESVNTPTISTGFSKLDVVLEGGLYEGLYSLGAVSSLGKTTLAMQIGDQIAEKGHEVIIFALEMSRNELISKSISRITLQRTLRSDTKDMRLPKTSRGITSGKRYSQYSSLERDLINKSVREYWDYAYRIYIQEGIGDLGVNDVREAVRRHIEMTDNKPVVIIDYLQILAPANIRATDKQNMDTAIRELKRISRDFKIPVIAISSLSRAYYKSAVTFEGFKESGAIEYGSDVVIGLQLEGAGSNGFDYDKAKDKVPREVELVLLKNRQGRVGQKIGFKYYQAFNYFEES